MCRYAAAVVPADAGEQGAAARQLRRGAIGGYIIPPLRCPLHCIYASCYRPCCLPGALFALQLPAAASAASAERQLLLRCIWRLVAMPPRRLRDMGTADGWRRLCCEGHTVADAALTVAMAQIVRQICFDGGIFHRVAIAALPQQLPGARGGTCDLLCLFMMPSSMGRSLQPLVRRLTELRQRDCVDTSVGAPAGANHAGVAAPNVADRHRGRPHAANCGSRLECLDHVRAAGPFWPLPSLCTSLRSAEISRPTERCCDIASADCQADAGHACRAG